MGRQRGFTLLEVMVALGIFALLSTACYQLLNSLSVSRVALQGATDQRQALSKALLVIEQDMRHLIPRSVRFGGSNERLGALTNTGEGVLEFSRGGFPEANSLFRDSPRRVCYRLELDENGPVFYRVVYGVLDRVEESPHYRQALLADVAEVGFRFMDKDGRWLSEWPIRSNEDDPGQRDAKLAELPRAVEVALALGSRQTVQRIISLQ